MRALHHQFEGFQVLGFPCNQFGAQEPGTEAEILEFVTSKFDVDFPMFAKIDVNGENQTALYSLLKSAQPGEGQSPDIVWNFEKFLVDKQGNVVKRFPPITTPEDVSAFIPGYL